MQVAHGNLFLPAGNKTNTNTPFIANQGNLQHTSGINAQANGPNFAEVLSNKVSENDALQFSKHAEMRLKSRDISLTKEQLERAQEGVSKAKQKGIRDSLVLVDDVALVVNTKSSVVITALQGSSDNVFTNIDGAVIV